MKNLSAYSDNQDVPRKSDIDSLNQAIKDVKKEVSDLEGSVVLTVNQVNDAKADKTAVYTKGESNTNFAPKTHTHNLADIVGLVTNGGGTKYLADDGTYKTISGGGTTDLSNYFTKEQTYDRTTVQNLAQIGGAFLGTLRSQPTEAEVGFTVGAGANRIAMLPPNQITVEQSTDQGRTWVPMPGITDAHKARLVVGNGVPDSPITVSKQTWVRITLDSFLADGSMRERYAKINRFHMGSSTNGSNAQIQIEASTIGQPDTFKTIIPFGQVLNTWPGHTFIKHSDITFGGGNNQTANNRKLRITVKPTTNLNTVSWSIQSLQWYGPNLYVAPDRTFLPVDGHLYTWDYEGNAKFLGRVEGKDPVNPQDFATKKYVDSKAGGGGGSVPDEFVVVDAGVENGLTSFVKLGLNQKNLATGATKQTVYYLDKGVNDLYNGREASRSNLTIKASPQSVQENGLKISTAESGNTKYASVSMGPIMKQAWQKALNIGTDSQLEEYTQVAMGYGMQGYFMKYGRFVQVKISGVANYGNGTMGEKIPEKFLPKQYMNLPGAVINSGNSVGSFMLELRPDGTIIKGGTQGHNEYYLSAMYIAANDL